MLGDLLMGHAYRVGAGTLRFGNQPNDLILVQRQQDRLDISPPLGQKVSTCGAPQIRRHRGGLGMDAFILLFPTYTDYTR